MSPVKPLLLMLLVLLSGFSLHNKPYLSKWVISKGGSLKVGGSTNVNKFSCVIVNYDRPDTLTFYRGSTIAEAIKIQGMLKLDVQQFNCFNPVMTSDLRKTLKAKEFPMLVIRFINISRYPSGNHEDKVKGEVTIELAGVARRFEVDYKYAPLSANTATLIGTRKINFTDFKLVPPRKIGGMIQTKDELMVEFNLKLKILN